MSCNYKKCFYVKRFITLHNTYPNRTINWFSYESNGNNGFLIFPEDFDNKNHENVLSIIKSF